MLPSGGGNGPPPPNRLAALVRGKTAEGGLQTAKRIHSSPIDERSICLLRAASSSGHHVLECCRHGAGGGRGGVAAVLGAASLAPPGPGRCVRLPDEPAGRSD